MIRGIRPLVGRTPGRLAEDDESILSALIDMKNYREIEPQVAAFPAVDANDSQ